MLCSSPAPKSCSTWLDRLRSSKGFATAGDLSLDHFLLHGSSDSGTSVPELTRRQSVEGVEIPTNGGEGGEEWLGVVSDVLSELFNVGGSRRSSIRCGKKLPRKQTNPRFCSVQVPNDCRAVRDDENAPDSTPSLNSDNKRTVDERERKIVGEVALEEDKDERELSGYSRSEVTIIDTSFEVWKVDKLVFRRKNVWKARDKKGNYRAAMAGRKKKRKGSVTGGNGSEGSKKAKIFTEARDAVDPLLPSDNDNIHIAGGRSDIPKQMENGISQVPQRMQLHSVASKSRLSIVTGKTVPGRKNHRMEVHQRHLKASKSNVKRSSPKQ